jgi:hypothetical protein
MQLASLLGGTQAKGEIMALYWPKKNVAFDIVDNPRTDHVPQNENWQIVCASTEELESFDSFEKTMLRLAHALGLDTPDYLAELERHSEQRRKIYESEKEKEFFAQLALMSF